MTRSKAKAVESVFARLRAGDGDCWIWTGSQRPKGYGSFVIGGRTIATHRWMYEFFRSEIPPGLVMDHLCRNTLCANPWHLEPVTIRENILRGNAPSVIAFRTGLCARGHSLADAYVVKSGRQKGRRNCRVCVLQAMAARRAVGKDAR